MYKGAGNAFVNRYRISGTLTARTPVHVGDGESLTVRDRTNVRPDDHDAEYTSFFTGANNTIFIPGSTIKGVVRSWLETHASPSPAVLSALFGAETGGGKVAFYDAPLTQRAQPSHETHRWWDQSRGTCLAPGVALNPSTRTAEDRFLYHTEYAPEGSVFAVTVAAQNLDAEERDLLRAALAAAFTAGDGGAHVGASAANGWGTMSWTEKSCEVMDQSDVHRWLASGAAQPYHTFFRAEPTAMVPLVVGAPAPALLLNVRLRFEGAVLVNDPSQSMHTNQETGQVGVGHATVRHSDGRPFLPGSSVRGALRAQTRRIWQTLAHASAQDLDRSAPTEAKQWTDVGALVPFYRMFGAPGWRTPISVSNFELDGDENEHQQEFVAVDRFTGGAADRRKFRAASLYAPDFIGLVRVDLEKWSRANVGGWAMLLLLFLLRDLQEGDVQVGFGRSKGYGTCTAEIAVRCVGTVPPLHGGDRLEGIVRGVLNREDDALLDPLLDRWQQELDGTLAA